MIVVVVVVNFETMMQSYQLHSFTLFLFAVQLAWLFFYAKMLAISTWSPELYRFFDVFLSDNFVVLQMFLAIFVLVIV